MFIQKRLYRNDPRRLSVAERLSHIQTEKPAASHIFMSTLFHKSVIDINVVFSPFSMVFILLGNSMISSAISV